MHAFEDAFMSDREITDLVLVNTEHIHLFRYVKPGITLCGLYFLFDSKKHDKHVLFVPMQYDGLGDIGNWSKEALYQTCV